MFDQRVALEADIHKSQAVVDFSGAQQWLRRLLASAMKKGPIECEMY
jgi:hypothetical protein